MSKKILALLLVVLMVIGLAACAKTPAATPETPAEQPEGEGEKAPEVDASGAAHFATGFTPDDFANSDGLVVAKDGTAELVVPYCGMTEEAYNTKIETYEAQGVDFRGEDDYLYNDYSLVLVEMMAAYFPNYKVQYVDWGWSEELDQKNRASLTAGNAPALLVGEVYAPNYVQEGIMATVPEDIVNAVYPSMVLTDANGDAKMINTTNAIFHCYINMDIYEECGYTEADFPKTWSELKAQSDAITAQGAGEFWGGAIPTFPNAGGTLRTTPWLRQMGVDYGEPGSVEMLSSPEALKTFEFIRSMGTNLPAGVGDNASETDMWAMWDDGEGNGTVCFIFDGTFRDSNNLASGINYACIALPTPDEGCVDAAANCAVGAVIVGVPAATKDVEAAFDALRVACSEDFGTEWMENARAVPNKKAMENFDYSNATDAFNALVDATKTGEGLIPGLVAWDNNSSAVWEIIGQKLTGPLTSDTATSIEDLVAAVQAEATPLLAK